MVAGLSRFVGDLQRPGMLYGAVVRSGRPHARILRVEASRAAKAPGVACVLTAADVPVNSYGLVLPDQPVLCGGKVRYEGDPVAALCATSWEAAEAAARFVRVRYEDLPAVTDPEEALRPESPLVHESHPTGNLVAQGSVIRGDIGRGFAEAEVIVEALEPRGPFGVKGVAGPSVNPTAPAVLNAICDAIGAEITGLPATPEAVLRAMGKVGNGRKRSQAEGPAGRAERPADRNPTKETIHGRHGDLPPCLPHQP